MRINDINNAINEFSQGNESARNSLAGYLENLVKIRDIQDSIKKNRKAEAKMQKQINALQAKAGVNGRGLTAEETKQLRILQSQVKVLHEQEQSLRLQRDLAKRNVTLTNAVSSTLKTTSSTIGVMGKKIQVNHKYWTDNMKAVRLSEKSMGVLSSQTATYRENLYQTSFYAADLGFHLSDLVEMQTAYADNLGRTVLLSMEEKKQMAGIAAGANLSMASVGELIGEMTNLGVSIQDSTAFFNRLGEDSRKKGLVTSKVFEKFVKILKEGNQYQFKGGTEGMKKMVELSEKFKLEFQTVSSFSDKVFDIEGAINMGAQLQVLGGKWAQIADPMQLMYKARNDMNGLSQDIVKGASEMAVFNDKTNEFEIPALQLHRMKGLAEFSGMTVDQMKDLAIQTAKVSKIDLEMGSEVPDDLREFVTSVAKFGKDGITVDFNGKTVPVKQLGGYVDELRRVLNDKQTLEEKAKTAQMFDEKIDNMLIKAKTIFYPLIETLDKKLEPLLTGMVNWINKNSSTIIKTIEKGSEYIGKIFDWMYDNPIESGIISSMALFGDKILAPAIWLANGITLRKGFEMGVDSGISGKTSSGWVNPSGKGMLAGGAMLAGGFGLDLGKDFLINNGTIESGGLADQGMSYGASALKGAGTGASLGAMFGPQAALIGGALGAIAGLGMHSYMQSKSNGISNDFISRPGSDPINFNSADTLIGLKKDGGLGKALLNQAGVGPGSSSVGGNIQLSPLTINGEIKLNLGNGITEKLDLKDPMLIREIARLVNEQLTINLAGKKTNGPIT